MSAEARKIRWRRWLIAMIIVAAILYPLSGAPVQALRDKGMLSDGAFEAAMTFYTPVRFVRSILPRPLRPILRPFDWWDGIWFRIGWDSDEIEAQTVNATPAKNSPNSTND